MKCQSDATIFALASAPGRSGVAVFRISGSEASACAKALTGHLPQPRRAELVRFSDPVSGEVLDRGLVLYFPAPRSFTGEDVLECHVHGGRAVIAGMAATLARMPGLRAAEPGEFTRRAFLAGKMDLAETEALADLIEADTAAQRRQALRGMENGVGRRADIWRDRLIAIQALVEADIDFSDEGDVPTGLIAEAKGSAAALRREILATLDAPGGERLKDGSVILVAGPPNAGKSSFLNHVAGRDVAIVTPYAGTTRDMIEISLDLGGYPVVLVDTAGIRETDDPVEREAIERARSRARLADLVLWFRDITETDSEPVRIDTDVPVWQVVSKVDRVPEATAPKDFFAVSVKTGAGIDSLLSAVRVWVSHILAPVEAAVITRQRHRTALEEAAVALSRALEVSNTELFAEELKGAALALGRVSGRIDVEDVLDSLFSSFCIGK